MTKKTKTDLTMDVLLHHGRITESIGHAVHGRYHVGGAIYRLRTADAYKVPRGYEIVSYDRYDVKGNLFTEWRLEEKEKVAA